MIMMHHVRCVQVQKDYLGEHEQCEEERQLTMRDAHRVASALSLLLLRVAGLVRNSRAAGANSRSKERRGYTEAGKGK
jgi:hypothetical protein